MKKLFIFLLLAVLLFETYANTQTCAVDSVIELKMKKIIASTTPQGQGQGSSYLPKLTCQSVLTRGAFATCPSGFEPTGCSCGMRCGSWHIRHNTMCNCGCANIDWTSARCCKIT